jgi:hypothetical protein
MQASHNHKVINVVRTRKRKLLVRVLLPESELKSDRHKKLHAGTLISWVNQTEPLFVQVTSEILSFATTLRLQIRS